MSLQRVLDTGWTGFHGGIGDDAVAHTATTDLINLLDTVEVPIIVVRRDLRIACYNKAAGDVLGLSPLHIGRASRDISVLAGSPRLEQQCSHVLSSGIESRVNLHDGDR